MLPQMCADVDELILFRRKEWGKAGNFPNFLRFLKSLKQQQWDYVIDAQGLFRSGLCARFAGNRKNTYGFADARELSPLFYAHKITVPESIVHAVDKNIYLLNQALGLDETYQQPCISSNEEATQAADQLMADRSFGGAPMIAVAVSSRWASKNWPPEFFAAVISKVNERIPGINFWMLGTEEERQLGERVASLANLNNLHNLAGETAIGTVVEMLHRSALLLTNDSGPMHIAAALSTPTFSMFGPTCPDKTGPYGDIHRIYRSRVDCSPCFKRICPLPDQICHQDIPPDEVANSMCEVLGSTGGGHA